MICTYEFPRENRACTICTSPNPSFKPSDDGLAKALEEIKLEDAERKRKQDYAEAATMAFLAAEDADRKRREEEAAIMAFLAAEAADREQKADVVQFVVCPVCTTRNQMPCPRCKTCGQDFGGAAVFVSKHEPVALALGPRIYDQGGVLDAKLATELGITNPGGTRNKCMANAAMYLASLGKLKDRGGSLIAYRSPLLQTTRVCLRTPCLTDGLRGLAFRLTYSTALPTLSAGTLSFLMTSASLHFS